MANRFVLSETSFHGAGAIKEIAAEIIGRGFILPTVMEYNVPATGEKYRAIAKAMGEKGVDAMFLEDARKAAIDAVKQISIAVWRR